MSKLSKAFDAQESLASQIASTKQYIQDAEETRDALAQVNEIVLAVGEECQKQCQAQIGYVVTRCLQTVFPDLGLRFRLVFEQKRGQTETRVLLTDSQGFDYDPLESCGGGLIDVASFGLRLACMMLKRPRPEKVLVFDEPFKWVSASYRENIAQMLGDLASEFGVQIILVTHLPELLDCGDQKIVIG